MPRVFPVSMQSSINFASSKIYLEDVTEHHHELIDQESNLNVFWLGVVFVSAEMEIADLPIQELRPLQ